MKEKTSEYFRFIETQLVHPEQLVRSEAARLLGEIQDRRAVPGLVKMLRSDRRHSKINAIYALSQIGDKRAIPVLLEMAEDPGVFDFSGFYNHDMIRIAAALALALFEDARGVDKVSDLFRLEVGDAFVQLAPWISSLPFNEYTQLFKNRISLDFLLLQCPKGEASSAARIVESLGYYPAGKSAERIRKYLDHPSRYIRATAAEALWRCEPSKGTLRILKNRFQKEQAVFTKMKLALLLAPAGAGKIYRECLLAGLSDDDYFIRATACDDLRLLRDPQAVPAIGKCLVDKSFYVRLCAIEALEELSSRDVRSDIERLLIDHNIRVRMQAAKFLIR